MSQKNGVLIGAAALILLLAAYFIMSRQPEPQLESAYTIQHVEGLNRIEITPPPASQGAPSLIALERREGGWWLVQPVEAPVKEELGRELDGAFGRAVKADDLKIGQDRAADYLLDDPQAARVKLFTRGAPAPHVDMFVGKQMTVEGTRAVRTFIKPVGEPSIYRLQAGISFLRDPEIANWRSDRILTIQPDTVTRLTLTYPGQAPVIVKRAQGAPWVMEQPDPAMRLEDTTLNDLALALADLRASGFLDGQQALSEAGAVKLDIEHSGAPLSLLLATRAPKEDGQEPTWALQLKGDPTLYEVPKATGDRLAPSPEALRSLTMRTLDREKLTRIVYPSGVTLQKFQETWQLAAPERVEQLDPTKLDSALNLLTSLRAARRAPEISAQDAGLTVAARPQIVRIETTDGAVELMLGLVADAKDASRYARFSDSNDVYILDAYTARRLSPAASEWTGGAQPEAGP